MHFPLQRLLPALALLVCMSGLAFGQTNTTSEPNVPSAQEARDALIEVLQDPDSRAALIKQLQDADANGAADQETIDPPLQADAAVSENEDTSFVIRVGRYTGQIVDEIGALLERSMHSLKGLSLILSGDIPIKWDRMTEVFIQVGVVLGAAYATFWLTQFFAQKTYPLFAVKAQYGGWIMRTSILLLTTIVDALTIMAGIGVGYFVALVAYGGFETGVTLQESLALNAFFVVGMGNVALRFIFAPQRPELRILPFGDASSVYWYRRLRLFNYWLNFGNFLAVPVANLAVSFVLGNALRFLIVLSGMIYLMVLVLRNRKSVRKGAETYAESLQTVIAQTVVANLGRFWHLGALGYIIAIFAIWVTRPFDATTIILRSTGLSIVTVMAGIAISLIMTRAIRGGIRLPDDVNETLPALQGRLNAFIPGILKLIRFAVFVCTALVLFDVWGIVSVFAWVNSDAGAAFVSRYGSAFLVVFAGFAVWAALMSWVDLRLQVRSGNVVTARERTLFQLFRNASTVVIFVMTVLLALSEIGVEIGPLIAGAGVVGLAISFGAQTLVKDIITGAFIQIENAANEGDVITVAGITGTVEGITVRSVRIRDLDGTTHIIPFSSVDLVSNFTRGFSYHVAIIGVAYDTNITFAKDALLEAFERLRKTDFGPKIFGDLEVHGVTNFGPSSIDIRCRIKTSPGDQWSVGRAYNEFVKQVFDEREIEIPFPQVTYHAATPPFVSDVGGKKQKKLAPDISDNATDDAPPDG